jgi:hypothetical protein
MNPMRLWPYGSLHAVCAACAVTTAAVVACGSRTGLLVPGDEGIGTLPPGDDDSGSMVIGGDDGGLDGHVVEPPRDALPPLDVSVPGDAFNSNSSCPDAGATLIYVVTEQFELMSFYPPTAAFTAIGALSCPTMTPSTPNMPVTPFSMAVNRSGIAFVLYNDGELFRVSTATAACQRTAFTSGQRGFAPEFGMGFSHDAQGTGETLFVASGGTTPRLATINTTNFGLRIVGNLAPAVESSELTGTGAGDLFAFYATTGANPCDNINTGNCPDSAIGQIDKTTGRVTNQTVLFGQPQGTAWAFAFWGGDFYTFTAPDDGGTLVTRFNPTDGSSVVVAHRTDKIVGAGVSTCAPAQ